MRRGLGVAFLGVGAAGFSAILGACSSALPDAPRDAGESETTSEGGSAPSDAGEGGKDGGSEASKPGIDAGGTDAGPHGVIALAAGTSHTCALFGNASVKCWGDNVSGDLGLGDTAPHGSGAGEMGASLPVLDLGPGRTVKAIAAGYRHTCAILDDDSVKCWGLGVFGELGNGDQVSRGAAPNEMGASLPRVDLGPGRTARAIAAGSGYTCVILDNGAVKCWGQNLAGELGLGDTNDRGTASGQMGASLPAVDLGAGRTAKAIACGAHHTCAILDNDTVRCWGTNGSGELGLGDSTNRGTSAGQMGSSLPAVGLGPGRTAKQISTGSDFTCAILDNNAMKCWGFNGYGQLGLGKTADVGKNAGEMGASLPAVDLGPGRTARAVRASIYSTCAILDDRSVKCWGLNWFGELGLGENSAPGHLLDRGDSAGEMGASLPAVDLGPGRSASAISGGHNFSCVILDDASVKCWGRNDTAQLGLGDTNDRGDAPGEMGAALPPLAFW